MEAKVLKRAMELKIDVLTELLDISEKKLDKAVSLLEDMGSFIKWSENDFSIHIDSVLHHKIKDIIKANSPDKE